MKTPIYWAAEYLDAAGFNSSAAKVSGDFAQTFGALSNPGLVRPDVLSIASTGLVAGISMPAPFGVVFGNGIFSTAHGVLTGQDSQNASVNLASLVPASGSATIYVVAQYAALEQDPFAVIGPQPGHESYNPDFTPYTAYATSVDSIAVSGQTVAPDNSTTFELCRFTLSAGATGLAAPNTSFQWLAQPTGNRNMLSVVANKTLGQRDIGVTQRGDVNGLHFTLPAPATFPGAIFAITSQTGIQTLQTTGGVLIYGYAGADGGSATSLSIAQGMTVTVQSDGVKYFVVGETGLGSAALLDSSAFDAAGTAAAVQAYVNANFLPLTGGTLTGSLTIAPASAPANLLLDGASGSSKAVIWQNTSTTIFDLVASAANNLFLRNWVAGTPQIAMSLTNAGQIAFPGNPTVGNLSPNDNSASATNSRYVDAGDAATYASGITYVNAYALPLAGGTLTGSLTVDSALHVLGLSYLDGAATLGSTLSVAGNIVGDANLTVVGTATINNNAFLGGNLTVSGAVVTLGDGVGSQTVIVNGASGTLRTLRWATAGKARWEARANNIAESGGNAGSNWSLVALADDGVTVIATLMNGTRSTGVMNIPSLTTTTQVSGDNSTNAATTAYSDRQGFGPQTTYHDVSANRSIGGGPYTNNKGRMIEVNLTFGSGPGSQTTLNVALIADGSTQIAAVGVPISGVVMNLHGFIPAGSTYQVTTNSGTGTFTNVRWIETY